MSDINVNGIEPLVTEQAPTNTAPPATPAESAPVAKRTRPRIGRYNQNTGETTFAD